ncbi:MAG: hypothetical protein HY553_10875 [Elusimicrobia bacterium]|nr:hypothetical protein [Elusimicrobiota bacterium]
MSENWHNQERRFRRRHDINLELKRRGICTVIYQFLSDQQIESFLKGSLPWTRLAESVARAICKKRSRSLADARRIASDPVNLVELELRKDVTENAADQTPAPRSSRDPLDELDWETNARVEGRKSIDDGWGPKR